MLQDNNSTQRDARDDIPQAAEAPRKIMLRRYADTPYESPFAYEEAEDTSTSFKRRWWHVAGALLLVGVLLLEIVLPIIQNMIAVAQLDPSHFGQPL